MTVRLAVLAVGLIALAGCAATVDEADTPEAEAATEKPKVTTRGAPPAKVAVAPPVIAAPEADQTPSPPKPQIYHRASEVEILMTEFERLRRLPAAEIVREQEAARQAFNQSRSDPARVRYAMTMSVPGAGNDEVRALDVLDPLVKNATAPLHGLAFLMAAYIQDMRRLVSQVQGLQQNAQGLQQNVQALQQKLDALRSLERSLSEREAGGRRR